MTPFKITKMDAARRQLATAIRLFAESGDSVSIHALTLAAHEVLRELNRAKGGAPMLAERGVLPGLDPSRAQEVVERAIRARNFIKHADRDPNKDHDFDPEDVECFLYDACTKHHDLAGAWVPAIKAYVCWFIATRPDLFRWTPAMSSLCDTLASIRAQTDRSDFFARMAAMIASGGV